MEFSCFLIDRFVHKIYMLRQGEIMSHDLIGNKIRFETFSNASLICKHFADILGKCIRNCLRFRQIVSGSLSAGSQILILLLDVSCRYKHFLLILALEFITNIHNIFPISIEIHEEKISFLNYL